MLAGNVGHISTKNPAGSANFQVEDDNLTELTVSSLHESAGVPSTVLLDGLRTTLTRTANGEN